MRKVAHLASIFFFFFCNPEAKAKTRYMHKPKRDHTQMWNLIFHWFICECFLYRRASFLYSALVHRLLMTTTLSSWSLVSHNKIISLWYSPGALWYNGSLEKFRIESYPAVQKFWIHSAITSSLHFPHF